MRGHRSCVFVRTTSVLIQIVLSLSVAVTARTAMAYTKEQAFLRENAAVMERMMQGMSAKPSGNIDADFVNMMEPHHRGAIAMAQLELRYGTNEQLRRIAQEIIVDQQQEIVAMRLALGRPLPAMKSTPDQDRSLHSTTGTPAR